MWDQKSSIECLNNRKEGASSLAATIAPRRGCPAAFWPLALRFHAAIMRVMLSGEKASKGTDMALSASAEKQLNDMANTLPTPTHHASQDYRKPIRVFIALYKAGDTESLHPDVIRDW